MRIHRFILASAFLMAVACTKEPVESFSDRDVIAFQVGENMIQTKMGVTNDNLESKATIITRGTEASKAISFNNSTDLKLKLDAETGYWFPNGNRSWKHWTKSGYSFTTYAYSPKNSSNVAVANAPTTVTITEPTSYSYGSEDDNFVDYLLSYRHDITDGMTRPIVTMKLEHALSNIEIYVIKDPSIQGVRVKSMSLSGLYNKAQMTCSQAQYVPNGTQPKNQWSASLQGGTNTYSWTDNNFKAADDEIEDSAAYLKFIAIPQSVSGLRLNVDLDVNEQDEEGVDHWVNHPYNNVSFSKTGLPANWTSGNKYIYILTVDTGIHLTGYVVEWKDGGSIETTILPDITDND